MTTPTTASKGAPAARPEARPAAPSPVIGSSKPATPARPAAAPTAPQTAPAAPTQAAPAQPATVAPAAAAAAQTSAPKQPLNTPATPPVAHEPRRVKLTLSRIDPFSVFKISFIISVALGLASIVVVAVLWMMLNAMGVFEQLGNSISDIQSSASTSANPGTSGKQSIADMLSFGRVMSLSVVFAVLNAVLMTAMATVCTFIYNVCAAMVGGLRMTLTDD